MEPRELERRRGVWRALGWVLLDTETRWFLPAVAAELLRAGYSPEEELRIWRHEALPEFGQNLMQVAGEWDALPIDEASLIRRAERGPGLVARHFAPYLGRWLSDQWSAIQSMRARLAALPEPVRAAHVSAWGAFARAYLEDPARESPAAAAQIQPLQRCGLGRGDCERTLAEDFLPIYRELLLREEARAEPARARRAADWIEQAFPET